MVSPARRVAPRAPGASGRQRRRGDHGPTRSQDRRRRGSERSSPGGASWESNRCTRFTSEAALGSPHAASASAWRSTKPDRRRCSHTPETPSRWTDSWGPRRRDDHRGSDNESRLPHRCVSPTLFVCRARPQWLGVALAGRVRSRRPPRAHRPHRGRADGAVDDVSRAVMGRGRLAGCAPPSASPPRRSPPDSRAPY